VRFRETSASEPLMRCQKQKDDVETRDLHYSRRIFLKIREDFGN